MKKLIAYSSVAHMGFVTMGIFTLHHAGRRGRDLPDAVATASSRPRCSSASASSTTACTPARSPPTAAWSTACRSTPSCFMLFTMANVGLPGTRGFVGEFLTLLGAFKANTWVAFLADDRRDPVGGLRALALSPRDLRRARPSRALQGISDLSTREIAIFAPLVLLTILFGIYPGAVPRRDGRVGREAGHQLQRSASKRRAGRVGVLHGRGTATDGSSDLHRSDAARRSPGAAASPSAPWRC